MHKKEAVVPDGVGHGGGARRELIGDIPQTVRRDRRLVELLLIHNPDRSLEDNHTHKWNRVALKTQDRPRDSHPCRSERVRSQSKEGIPEYMVCYILIVYLSIDGRGAIVFCPLPSCKCRNVIQEGDQSSHMAC